jgi:glycosyltransferase involved in cell wall biosynthesis
MNFAPVLVSVYNRLDHLRNCVDSLKLSRGSNYTDLYIASDAAHSLEIEPAIDAVRAYIRTIDGFSKVIPIERKENLGGFLSINSAIDFVLEKHGKVIFLEDDNVVSSNFLKFMNDCLECYHDDPSVFSICGYNFPIHIPKTYVHDIFKWQGFSAWGAGLWLDKWKQIDWSLEGINRFLSDKSKVKALNRTAEHVLQNLTQDILKKKQLVADTIISINLFKKNMYTIFPVASKVRNMGHDGSGEHGGVTDTYVKQTIDTDSNYRLVRNIEPDDGINQILRKHFRIPIKYKIAGITPPQVKKVIKKIINAASPQNPLTH